MRKSALNITWPKSFFTIQDICNEHPTAKNITIRFRINKAIEDNIIAYIGKNKTSVGRPTIVFAPFPVDESVLEQAINSGVILDEAYEDKIVKITKAVKKDDPTESEGVRSNLVSQASHKVSA